MEFPLYPSNDFISHDSHQEFSSNNDYYQPARPISRIGSFEHFDDSLKFPLFPVQKSEAKLDQLLNGLHDAFYPSPPANEQNFTFPAASDERNFTFPNIISPERPGIPMTPDLMPFDLPFMHEPSTSPFDASPVSPEMDWNLLSPMNSYEQSQSGPFRRKSSSFSTSSFSTSFSPPSSTGSNGYQKRSQPPKTMTCPQHGCFSTFSKLKHLKRHALKHGDHKHTCVNEGCGVTSYRSDMMRAHIKNCPMSQEFGDL